METNQQQQQQQSSQTSPVAPPQSGSDPQPGYQAQAQAQPYQHLLQQQQQQLQMFWSYQRQEIEQANDFKNHQLPLARIKKIMKADEDVRMISAEAPILFAKACELFILELTIRSWLHAEENKRRTLQKNDIAAAITRTDIFDFLVDIVPREEIKEEGGGGGGVAPGMIMGGVSGVGVPYYYPPIGQPAVGVGVGVGVGGVMMGRPAMDHVGMYGQTATQGAWPSVWQNGGAAVVPGSVAGGGADDGVFGNGGGGGGNAGQANLDGQSSSTHLSICPSGL